MIKTKKSGRIDGIWNCDYIKVNVYYTENLGYIDTIPQYRPRDFKSDSKFLIFDITGRKRSKINSTLKIYFLVQNKEHKKILKLK